jgi:hypothetical protein
MPCRTVPCRAGRRLARRWVMQSCHRFKLDRILRQRQKLHDTTLIILYSVLYYTILYYTMLYYNIKTWSTMQACLCAPHTSPPLPTCALPPSLGASAARHPPVTESLNLRLYGAKRRPEPRPTRRMAPMRLSERKSTAVRDQAPARAPARSPHGNYVWVGLELCRLSWKICYFKYGIF